MSNLSRIKDIIVNVLSDYEEHSSEDLRKHIQKEGISLDARSSSFRTAIFQLRNSGMNIESRERGVYRLIMEKKEERDLVGFALLKPEDRTTKRYIYIHENGKIILNGKLNNEIKSRKIEIRVSGDCEKIALIVDGENPHKFTKSGCTINKEFIKMVGRKKILFPISYEMKEEEKGNLWIGELKRTEKKHIR